VLNEACAVERVVVLGRLRFFRLQKEQGPLEVQFTRERKRRGKAIEMALEV